jgi:hypothetical protein
MLGLLRVVRVLSLPLTGSKKGGMCVALCAFVRLRVSCSNLRKRPHVPTQNTLQVHHKTDVIITHTHTHTHTQTHKHIPHNAHQSAETAIHMSLRQPG